MPYFHAAWSFGGLAGAGLGSLLAPHLSPVRHLLLVASADLVIASLAGRTLLTSVGPPPGASVRSAPPQAVPAWRRTLETSRVGPELL